MLVKKGFSLIEILVVIGLFALIGIVTSQAVLTTLKGSRVIDSEANIRQNVDYAMNIIERNLRNSKEITECPNTTDPTKIDYVDPSGQDQSIFYVSSGDDRYVAVTSNDNRLTSNQVRVTNFSIICSPAIGNASAEVNVTITATDPNATSDEAATITTSNKVVLRTNN